MKIYLQNDGQTLGPFTKDEVRHKVYSGELARTASACREGSPDWQPVDSLLSGDETCPGAVPPVAPPVIEVGKLRDPKEKTALIWLAICAVPAWLVIVGFTILWLGLPLLVLLVRFIGEMLFAAYIKTNAVRVSPAQLPELNAAVESCCRRLGMEHPDVYVLQHNIWNAFATKIFGRRMVVLFSGAVDSILLKGDMTQLTWLVGHELGHHWAGHLNLGQKLAKAGGWVVWLGLWHSRRAELTCDRVALYCAASLKSSQLALINATVGAQLAGRVNIEEATKQWREHSGEFFVRYRTLYSTHPHLLARLDHLNQAAQEFGLTS